MRLKSKDRPKGALDATDWILAYQEQRLSDVEQREFLAWVRESPKNISTFLEATAATAALKEAALRGRDSIDALVARARAAPPDNVEELRPAKALAPRREPRWPLALAAGFVLAALASLWVVTARDGERLGLPLAYQTTRGERSLHPLPDGSSVELNAATAITIRYRSTERRIDLDRGQAVFNVRHGLPREFRVHAGPATVVAVGTKFDVERRDDATIVTVIEGRVRVTRTAGEGGAAGESILLGSGEQVRVEPGLRSLAPSRVDVQFAEAWRTGHLVFEDRALKDIVPELNRYAPLPFAIDDPAVGALKISGVLASDDPESFVRFLETLDGVTVERRPDALHVLRSTVGGAAEPGDTR